MTQKNYLNLPDKVLLATVLERLDNLVDHFERHVDDDKAIVVRVGILENRLWQYTAICSVIGFIFGKFSVKWF